jgi:hypothetical protein
MRVKGKDLSVRIAASPTCPTAGMGRYCRLGRQFGFEAPLTHTALSYDLSLPDQAADWPGLQSLVHIWAARYHEVSGKPSAKFAITFPACAPRQLG